VFTERIRDTNRFVNLRHVAVLTALLINVVAGQPFLIRHLLRDLPDHLPAGSQRFGDQRVAGRAQFRLPDLLAVGGTEASRGGSHDAPLPFLDLERAKLVALASLMGGINDEPADEAIARA